ncbi:MULTISPECIES: DUF1761 domain-containing protein [Aestuariibaculum]|uniref:DUF1761 domain-containing protein n=1 Tax=Aestuariibaculum lutulentum TaxID=2920935 RepID=A0ABS9RGT0_9FLAO|nr:MULTISPECIES: DUF1761 domain-containing protein [Aestuariibaculum]MCH4552151.1 DUF1761 domain-containing protein [Aestuariibaculum lutulentum]MCR8667244.1 DUF1761 domain-containing protein [Aestuariibaculum sp. M13]
MDFNLLAIIVAAFSALLVGFIWYHPKVFGTAWMQAADMTEEKMQGANMGKIFGLALLFSFFLAFALQFLTIHQSGAVSMVGGDVENALPSFHAFMEDYGTAFRTFKHGVLHGVIAGIFIAMPILGINALFERRSGKYILIHTGYWIVTLALMGGIVCAWQ